MAADETNPSQESPATEKQLAFVQDLSGKRPNSLTKKKASELIDRLLREQRAANGPLPESWEKEPASDAQLDLIEYLCGIPDPTFTKAQASRMIDTLRDQEKKREQERERADKELAASQPAYYLSLRVQEASARLAEIQKEIAETQVRYEKAIQEESDPAQYPCRERQAVLDQMATAKGRLSDLEYKLQCARQSQLDWWLMALGCDVDICSGAFDLPHDALSLATLYFERCGSKFLRPAKKYVRAVLKALDREEPNWAKENPERFFDVLWGNFPKLRRKRQRTV